MGQAMSMNTYRVTLRCTIPMRTDEDLFEYLVEARGAQDAKRIAQHRAYDRCYNHAAHPVVSVELVWHGSDDAEATAMLLGLLKRALPHLEHAERHYQRDVEVDELGSEASRQLRHDVSLLQAQIVDELLAQGIKPFDDCENDD